MAKKITKTKKITIYFTDSQYAYIENMSDSIGIPRSTVVQLAVDAFFKETFLPEA